MNFFSSKNQRVVLGNGTITRLLVVKQILYAFAKSFFHVRNRLTAFGDPPLHRLTLRGHSAPINIGALRGRVEEPPKVFVLSWFAFQKCRFTCFFGFWPQSVGVYGLFLSKSPECFLVSICAVLSYFRSANLKNTAQNEHFWGFFHATPI